MPGIVRRGKRVHATLADTVIDIVANSVEAGASVVVVSLEERGKLFTLTVSDNGSGMDEATLRRVRDPFSTCPGKHPGRSVGLGISFLAQTVQAGGGTFDIRSEPGVGTSLECTVDTCALDCPPVGERGALVAALLTLGQGCAVRISRRCATGGYVVDSQELLTALGELETVASHRVVRTWVKALEEDLAATGCATD